MEIERQIAYWKDGAAEDFDVALALLEKNRTRHALFFAELALEKILKAHVTKKIRETPPRTSFSPIAWKDGIRKTWAHRRNDPKRKRKLIFAEGCWNG